MLPYFPPVRFPFARVEYRLQASDHGHAGGIDQDTIANNSYLSFEYRARARMMNNVDL